MRPSSSSLAMWAEKVTLTVSLFMATGLGMWSRVSEGRGGGKEGRQREEVEVLQEKDLIL